MIPKQMEEFLRMHLPDRTWKSRLVQEDGKCFIDFGPTDIDRLNRLGIEADHLGPKLVACLWDEQSDLEIGGYLVIDNLAMGRPSMGGIRMLPDLTPGTIFNLARGMTLKNAAANLPYGGGKAGIVCANAPEEKHTEIIRRFARLLYRYRDIYLPGPDVGTNDADMKTIAIENGLDNALSKPVEMGGNRIDRLGAAGGGLIIALDALIKELPRLLELPQFSRLTIPEKDQITVLIQGFGAVGAQAAKQLRQRLPAARVVGVSDISGFLYDQAGLPIDELYNLWEMRSLVIWPYYHTSLASTPLGTSKIKFSNAPDDLLRESAFCLIPAAPMDNYLGADSSSCPSMTTDKMGTWNVIIEGANTYSPIHERKLNRHKMEREVYRNRGILITPDYLVNSGGVIYAAQEHLIKTPAHLRIPDSLLGDQPAVEKWLNEHVVDLAALAEIRLMAAEKAREEVIRSNMRELVDLLLTDADMLPSEAAERISIRRITAREKNRTAEDIMESIITLQTTDSVPRAAQLLVETGCPILAVINSRSELAGVVTNWDITRAASKGPIEKTSLDQIMTRQVISASPSDSILDIVRKLEHYEISAMPVVEGRQVRGMISTDILSRRSLFRLLQSQSI
jgi:glutamate dehydrogenase/leucine dehydrogenase/predicted transcriptional regulator